MAEPQIDPDALKRYSFNVWNFKQGEMVSLMIHIGDRLGLYRAMNGAGPLSAAELAARTGLKERWLFEWLRGQTAARLLDYHDPDRFELSPVGAAVLADESSSLAFAAGAFSPASTPEIVEKLCDAFRTGIGLSYEQLGANAAHRTERMLGPWVRQALVPKIIPALDGVQAKLKHGAHVADVGCGHGTTTVLMAKRYPGSTFVGYDYHAESIAAAREEAAREGVAERVRFEVASAKEYPGKGFDLVTVFDCLHDMGDPVGAAKHVRASLKDGGTWMIVEPFAHDRIEENLNPVGRVYYSASTAICTPASRSQEVGLALGAQAGEARLREVVQGGGFARFRRATETPFNLVFEARA